MSLDVQDYVYMLDNEIGEAVPSRLVVDGQSRLLEPDHPCVSRLNCGSMQGAGVQFYNQNNEVECGVQVKDYHYFLDENNQIRPIPPGSILQGLFNVVSKSPQTPAPCIQYPSTNNLPNQINPVIQISETSITVSQSTSTCSEFGNDSETQPVDTQTPGYYENLGLSQGMDIELEEEIISCDIAPQKKGATKNSKAPSARRVRKKKGGQVATPKTSPKNQIAVAKTPLNNHLNSIYDGSTLKQALNRLTPEQLQYITSNLNATT